MTAADPLMEQVTALLVRLIQEGRPVEVEGLGTFQRGHSGTVEFIANTRPRIFIAYADENYRDAERLFDALTELGFDPWLDKKKLLPGQNWPRAIERSIEVSDFFIACFSRLGLAKRGHFHSELRYALECASRLPLGEIFFVPVRLDECPVPAQIARQLQYVDLFPSWDKGFERLLRALRQQKRSHPRAA